MVIVATLDDILPRGRCRSCNRRRVRTYPLSEKWACAFMPGKIYHHHAETGNRIRRTYLPIYSRWQCSLVEAYRDADALGGTVIRGCAYHYDSVENPMQ